MNESAQSMALLPQSVSPFVLSDSNAVTGILRLTVYILACEPSKMSDICSVQAEFVSFHVLHHQA